MGKLYPWDYIDYIVENSSKRNLIYLNTPQKIESFATELSSSLKKIESEEVDEIIEILSGVLHEEYNNIDCLKKGVLYLHGNIPDDIKDYLEYKFRKVESIKYLVANSVITEGVNLPIETMFILNTHRLDYADLVNLIGRVNRLNMIFDKDDGKLSMLIPNIYFVKCDYSHKGANISSTINRLNIKKDKVDNPLLLNTTANKEDIAKYQMIEDYISKVSSNDQFNLLKRRLITTGTYLKYKNFSDDICKIILNNIQEYNKAKLESSSVDVIDLVYLLFIKNLENEIYPKIERLKNKSVRSNYKKYIEETRRLPFKSKIDLKLKWCNRRSVNGHVLYVGNNGDYTPPGSRCKNQYVNLDVKTHKDRINYIIINDKYENEFISYELGCFFQLMNDLELITDDDYYTMMYGSRNKEEILFAQNGLSPYLIDKLKSDKQLPNISVNKTNNLVGNDDYYNYLNTVDDFTRYCLNKIIRKF